MILARGVNCTNVHLARPIAGVQKVGLDVHDISRASGSADVLGYESVSSRRVLQWSGKRISRIRSVARTVSSRRRINGRAMGLVNGHDAFLALCNRGAPSILDASFQVAQAPSMFSEEFRSIVRIVPSPQ